MQANATINRTDQLATLIERDIHRRGLSSGDRYLTDRETAEQFRVSQVTAHRAMRALAKRDVVVRRRRAGTFVGPKVRAKTASAIQIVHYLMPSWVSDDFPLRILSPMRKQLPDVQVQLNHIPDDEPLAFLRRLVEQGHEANSLFGIVVASSSREVRQFFNGQDLPVVVSGHVEADIDLPWVDRDQRQIGRLLAGHLLEQNHQSIALIMRNFWGPGDNLLMDSVEQTVRRAGASLTARSIPSETGLIRQNIRELLERSDRPTGFICRSQTQAVCCAEAAESLGLKVPDDVCIVATNVLDGPTGSGRRFPHTSLDPAAFGHGLGELLMQRARGQRPDPYHYEIPVSVIDPYQDT